MNRATIAMPVYLQNLLGTVASFYMSSSLFKLMHCMEGVATPIRAKLSVSKSLGTKAHSAFDIIPIPWIISKIHCIKS